MASGNGKRKLPDNTTNPYARGFSGHSVKKLRVLLSKPMTSDSMPAPSHAYRLRSTKTSLPAIEDSAGSKGPSSHDVPDQQQEAPNVPELPNKLLKKAAKPPELAEDANPLRLQATTSWQEGMAKQPPGKLLSDYGESDIDTPIAKTDIEDQALRQNYPYFFRAPAHKLDDRSTLPRLPAPKPECERIMSSSSKQTPQNGSKGGGTGPPVLSNPISTARKMIETRLILPIKFFEHYNDCNWCEDIFHGLGGGNKHQVELHSSNEGVGVATVDGSVPNSCSYMCRKCTSTRITIATCRHHVMVPMSAGVGHFDIDRWCRPGKANQAPFQWCSVCPGAAMFRCQVPGRPLDDNGCGLLLCAACHEEGLHAIHRGLERLLAWLKMDGIEPRADVDLLRHDGYLMQNVGKTR